MKTYARKTCPAPRPADAEIAATVAAETDATPAKTKRTKITDYFAPRICDGDDGDGGGRGGRHKAAGTNCGVGRALQQTFLDLGQKGLAVSECAECGLCYDHSLPQDRRRHRVEHERALACFQVEKYERLSRWRHAMPNGDVVLAIRGSDLPPSGVRLLEKINDMMAAVQQQIEAIRRMTVYMYANGRTQKIVGLLSTEPVSAAVRVRVGSDADAHAAEDIVPVVVGVARIWTSAQHRRRGIALRLLASIRRCAHRDDVQCSSACAPAPSQVAFSQPTEAGRRLAVRYLQSSHGTPRGPDALLLYPPDGEQTPAPV